MTSIILRKNKVESYPKLQEQMQLRIFSLFFCCVLRQKSCYNDSSYYGRIQAKKKK